MKDLLIAWIRAEERKQYRAGRMTVASGLYSAINIVTMADTREQVSAIMANWGANVALFVDASVAEQYKSGFTQAGRMVNAQIVEMTAAGR